jgi:murein DD-endopeptidase MepM/ murein hydrolase activator NlpD
MRTVLLTLFLAAAGLPAAANPPQLNWPVDCVLGETCFIEDYMDHNPAAQARHDFTCGLNTRDAHRGTDIAIPSFDTMERGVAVRAAAAGTVLRIRDSMPDDITMTGVTDSNACGNAVILDHGDGWQTLYCHLQLGSVMVRPGRDIPAGQILGLIGLSGQTNHPHLHFSVLHNGKDVDPFAPSGAQTCPPQEETNLSKTDTLWADTPPYYRTALLTSGFADHIPALDSLAAARLETTQSNRPLVLYAHMGHAQPGDRLSFQATGPNGNVFSHEMLLENPKRSQMQAFGRRAPKEGWPKGAYQGDVTLTRDGILIAHRFAHVTMQ